MKNNVRIYMPSSIESWIKLGNELLKGHTSFGNASPLKAQEIAEFTQLMNEVNALNEEIINMERVLSEKAGERNHLLGNDPDQSLRIEGSIQYWLAKFRDVLKGEFKTKERKLLHYGYKVRFNGSTGPRDDGANAPNGPDADPTDIGIDEEGIG